MLRESWDHLPVSSTVELGSHKGPRVRAAIEAAGARLPYLPPRQASAGLEALLRKAAGRTVDGPWGAIASVPDPFTPAGCANCLAAAGYDAD
jgi:hypothetical protein